MLKLTRLPHGTNRNRALRRPVDSRQAEVDLAESQRLFRRFWKLWQAPQRRHGVGA